MAQDVIVRTLTFEHAEAVGLLVAWMDARGVVLPPPALRAARQIAHAVHGATGDYRKNGLLRYMDDAVDESLYVATLWPDWQARILQRHRHEGHNIRLPARGAQALVDYCTPWLERMNRGNAEAEAFAQQLASALEQIAEAVRQSHDHRGRPPVLTDAEWNERASSVRAAAETIRARGERASWLRIAAEIGEHDANLRRWRRQRPDLFPAL